jgi:AcrR family transcriptional regulator
VTVRGAVPRNAAPPQSVFRSVGDPVEFSRHEPSPSSRMTPPAKSAPPARGARARQDTRAKLLRAAIKVFAKDGYAGGRIESISKAARSHDRMIYYYFGSKEKLFVEVLETIYAQFNEAEAALKLDFDTPVEALTTVVHFTWRYYIAHPEFVALLSSENLHQGKLAQKSSNLDKISAVAVGLVGRILTPGQVAGLFRPELKARDVYLMIASLAYFYNSNRYTLSAFLGEDMMAPASLAHWETFITETVLRNVAVRWPLFEA